MLEKANVKVNQMKLKQQTVQGDMSQFYLQVNQYKAVVADLEHKNKELAETLRETKAKWK